MELTAAYRDEAWRRSIEAANRAAEAAYPPDMPRERDRYAHEYAIREFLALTTPPRPRCPHCGR